MKSIFYMLLFSSVALLPACQSPTQKQAQQTADAIQKAKKAYGPPEVTTSANGYSMKAVIDGKPWKAKSMMEINASNEHYISGEGGNTRISFYIDRDHITLNRPDKLYTGNSADLAVGDKLMSAKSGELTITKADDNAIEGSFHFSATSVVTGDKAEVTGGFFRVLIDKNK